MTWKVWKSLWPPCESSCKTQNITEAEFLVFTVTSTALPWDFYFAKLTQPLTVFTVQLLYTSKEKGRKPDRKPYPLSYGLRNPYGNLKSENSQDYAQKPQRNSASVPTIVYTDKVPIFFLQTRLYIPKLHSICGFSKSDRPKDLNKAILHGSLMLCSKILVQCI